MTDKLTVSVLGTGIMGAGMARNLARAGGLAVRAWNRSRAKAEPLAADGITVTGTPAEAVEGADVVLTMLYDGPAVLDVMREAAPALRRGTVWVQSTTAGIEAIGDLAAFADKHGLVFFDAPVLGTRQPAETGRLTVLAAGPADHRHVVAPVFGAVGARTVWTGEDGGAGRATRLKLVANSWVLAATAATGEVVALAQALDVEPETFFGLIADGPLDMGYLRAKATTEQGYPLRRLTGVQLVDVAPVNVPAYPDSSAGLRSLADKFEADLEEVRSMAEADELRKFFVRSDGPAPQRKAKKGMFGPAAAAALLARREDPYV